jgi:abortive infection bacteriophage resistance protein
MPKVPYNKPALSYQQQLQQLEERGLEIGNKPKAYHLLESVSYYRLSGYWYPFLKNPKSDHVFKEGASFDAAFDIYCFDRELRKLIAGEMEKIEVAIRAKMIYILSHSKGAFWFKNRLLFKKRSRHTDSLDKLKKEKERSDEQFIKSFSTTLRS